MTKENNINTFINETYSKPSKKNYPTNKLIHNHIDEIWSIDLADFSDFKISNNKGCGYISVTIDNFSNFLWCAPIKNKNCQTTSN